MVVSQSASLDHVFSTTRLLAGGWESWKVRTRLAAIRDHRLRPTIPGRLKAGLEVLVFDIEVRFLAGEQNGVPSVDRLG